MITRRGLLEAAGGAVAFGSGGALAAPAGSAALQEDTRPWLSPSLPAGTRAEAVSKLLPAKNR